MAYSPELAERVRRLIKDRPDVTERKMFGGLCFFLNGNMLCGIETDRYVFRVGKQQHAYALSQPGCSEMTLTGRSMGGFVYVAEASCEGDGLTYWLSTAETFVGSLPAKEKQ